MAARGSLAIVGVAVLLGTVVAGQQKPEVKINRFITGMDEVAAHGSRDMPVWGTLFRSLDINNQAAAQMRVQVLTDYLKSIQK